MSRALSLLLLCGATLTLPVSSSLGQSGGVVVDEGNGTEEEVRNRLALKIGYEEASKYVDRFGETAEDSLELESSIKLIRSRITSEVDMEAMNAAIQRIATKDSRGLSKGEKRKLARSWVLIRDVTRSLDGDTPLALEQLKIARDLDPEDTSLAKEVEFQQRRQDIIANRLAVARATREGIVVDAEAELRDAETAIEEEVQK